MIFKLKTKNCEMYAQAKSQLHLLQSYHQEYSDFMDIEEVTEVTDEQAKNILLINNPMPIIKKMLKIEQRKCSKEK